MIANPPTPQILGVGVGVGGREALLVKHPKLLDGLIANPKIKTMEGEGIEARSLARSTLG